MKSKLLSKRVLVLFILLLGFSPLSQAFAQFGITGTVTDWARNPIIGGNRGNSGYQHRHHNRFRRSLHDLRHTWRHAHIFVFGYENLESWSQKFWKCYQRGLAGRFV